MKAARPDVRQTPQAVSNARRTIDVLERLRSNGGRLFLCWCESYPVGPHEDRCQEARALYDDMTRVTERGAK